MAKKTQATPRTFEEALAELETILREMEAGQIGLEESLARYERGSFLVQHCRGVLTRAEKQIETLSSSAEGTFQSRPLPGKVPPVDAEDRDADGSFDGGADGEGDGADRQV